MTEFKPCPWCKGELVIHEDDEFNTGFYGHCSPCNFNVGLKQTESELLEFLNTRPIEDELRARVKELESRLDAYAESNAKLMEEKLRDAQLIKQLEAWQKEAVRILKKERDKCKNLLQMKMSETTKIEVGKRLSAVKDLIKQAEGN